MRNVEIKAKVHNLQLILQKAEELSGGPPTVIEQDDTFYNVQSGRLKMRFYKDRSATLVRYDRNDIEGPKMCDYDLLNFKVGDKEKANELHGMLSKCLGVRGRVVKERKLFMVGQTRVHIDQVKGLGDFMELEVVLNDEQTLDEGQTIARELQKSLGVEDSDLIECAYMDLLNKGN